MTVKCIAGDRVTITELQEVTAKDDTLQEVIRFIKTQWPPMQQVPANLFPYYHT